MPDLGPEGRPPQPPHDRRSGGAHRHGPLPPARHTSSAQARQQRQARLVRTIIAVVVVLGLASALSGYLLHGRGQSAAGSPATEGVTTPAQPRATTAPTTTATSPASRSATPSTSASTRPASATSSTTPVSVPAKGNGRFTPVTVPRTTTVRTGREITYSLQVEGGMHADTAAIAKAFGDALLDRRGWQGVDHVRFVQVSPKQVANGTKPQMRVLVASPDQVNKLCAPLPTHGDTSCDTSAHVVLNYKLWMKGVVYFKGHLAEYREYMVNHEVGHALGHGHQLCSKKGAYAPVMQQQTLGLQGCKAWPWPKRPNSAGKA